MSTMGALEKISIFIASKNLEREQQGSKDCPAWLALGRLLQTKPNTLCRGSGLARQNSFTPKALGLF